MNPSDFGAVRSVDASMFGAVKSAPDEELSSFGPAAIYTNPEGGKKGIKQLAGVGATVASGALKGLAGLEDTMLNMGEEFARLVGLPTTGVGVNDLAKASDLMKRTAGHLDEYAKETGVSGVGAIPGEVVGGLPVSFVEWGPKKIGVVYATLKEAAAARGRGEDWGKVLKAGAKGGLKRLILGKLLDKYSEIENAFARRGLGAATLAGDAALSGGDTTEIVTAATMGGLLTGYGGKPTAKVKVPETLAVDKPAAYRLEDGTILTGISHPTIYVESSKEIQDILGSGKAEDGFVTKDGRFVEREEGLKIASESKQVDPVEAKRYAEAGATGLDALALKKMQDRLPQEGATEVVTPTQTLEQALEAEGLNRPLKPGSPEAVRAGEIRKAQTGDVVEPPPTAESIGAKVEEHIKNVQDLRTDVADPANTERAAKMAEAYGDARQRALEMGQSSEAAHFEGMKASEGIKSQTPDITPPKLTQPERDFLFRENDRINTDEFDHINTGDALNKWLNGKIPEPADFQYLARILGIKNTTKLFHKTQRMEDTTGWGILKQIVQAFKLPFSFDPQYFRQASAISGSHPVEFVKGGGVALRAYKSAEYAAKLDARLKTNPNHKDAAEFGVGFLETVPWRSAEAAEQFALGRPIVHELLNLDVKGATGKVVNPTAHLMARVYLASERSLVTSVNYLMQNLWDIQMKHFDKKGVTGKELIEYKTNYADTLNTMMKLFKFKSKDGKAFQKVMNYFVFSPGYTLSRPALLIKAVTNKGSRMEAASAIATTIGKMYLISALAKATGMLWKDENGKPMVTSSLDPRSSDWGYIRSGDGKWDFGIGGGDTAFYRDIARLANGHYRNQAGVVKEAPRLRTLENMAKSKETALIGVMAELATGRDYSGNKIWEVPDWAQLQTESKGIASKAYGKAGESLVQTKAEEMIFLTTREMIGTFAPQILGDIFNASLNVGWGGMLATGASGALSGSQQMYPESASISMQKSQNDAAQIEHQKDWDMLSPRQQQKIERDYPEIGKWEQQAKFERSEKDLEVSVKPKELKLPADVRRTLKDATVPYPAVSRNIGSRFFLNDDRLKEYQKLAADLLTQRIRTIRENPDWDKASPEKKQRWVTTEVDRSKEMARRQLMKQYEQEAK